MHSYRQTVFVASALAATVFVVGGCAEPDTPASVGPGAGTVVSSTAAPGAISSTAATGSESAVPGAGPSPTHDQLAHLRQLVDQATTANGDSNAEEPGSAVLSTRAKAVKLLFDGETVDSDGPSIVAVVHGTFTGAAFDHPPQGKPAAGGDTLVVVYDLSSWQGDVELLDSAGGHPVPSLSELGTVVSF